MPSPSLDGYNSYEEFTREELKRTDRISVSYEDLLGEFVDDGWRSDRRRGEGLFDSYEEDE